MPHLLQIISFQIKLDLQVTDKKQFSGCFLNEYNEDVMKTVEDVF